MNTNWKISQTQTQTRTRSLYVGCFSLLIGAVACGGTTDEASLGEAAVNEGAAYLTIEDENLEELGDTVTGAVDDTDVDAVADEETDGVPDPSEALSVCDFEGRRARVMERYDANGDGQLDARERRELGQDLRDRTQVAPRLRGLHRKARHFTFHLIRWSFDTDNSGDLDENERSEMIAALGSRCEARRARILENFDADGDGSLSAEELQAARAAHRARLAEKRSEVLATYDANENGVLDFAEQQAWKATVRARIMERKAAIKDQFDADDDGKLSADEIAALKAAVRARVAEGPVVR